MSITSSAVTLPGRAHSIVMHLASGFDIAGTAIRLGLSRSEVTAEIAATCRRHGIQEATASVFVGVALRRNLITWPPPPPDLDPEQVDILELIEAGYSTRMIADDLGLSLGTAGHRVEQLLHALVAINRTHAVALGYQYGILGRS
ncbi:LuxR C-terminal-related transcriptional regulator, partial [Streptomyces sp. NPDC051129]